MTGITSDRSETAPDPTDPSDPSRYTHMGERSSIGGMETPTQVGTLGSGDLSAQNDNCFAGTTRANEVGSSGNRLGSITPRRLSRLPAPLTIIVDTREQAPLVFADHVTVVRDGLATGDYTTPELASTHAVERKSLADLVGSLTAGRERFMRVVARLEALERAAIVVESTVLDLMAGMYRSRTLPWSVLASTLAIADRGVPVIWAGNREHAARCVEWLLRRWSERRTKRTKRMAAIEQAAALAAGWAA